MSATVRAIGNERIGRHSSFQGQRNNTVIILERDGSLAQLNPDPCCAPIHGYAELPADLAGTDLIDRLLAFAFDTLGLTALEMRVREHQ